MLYSISFEVLTGKLVSVKYFKIEGVYFRQVYKLPIIVFLDTFIKNETTLIQNNSSKPHLSSLHFMGVLNMAFHTYVVGQIIL
jgi:hypothetical protein